MTDARNERFAFADSGSEGEAMTTVDLYLHSGKESNYEAGERIGLSEEALGLFMHAGSEHRMTYEVDPRTGAVKLIAVDGRELLPLAGKGETE